MIWDDDDDDKPVFFPIGRALVVFRPKSENVCKCTSRSEGWPSSGEDLECCVSESPMAAGMEDWRP